MILRPPTITGTASFPDSSIRDIDGPRTSKASILRPNPAIDLGPAEAPLAIGTPSSPLQPLV
ncbi:hypothetical protein CCMA1212_001820 [Trichoderma ghanense]|uniref:Uncharacterized protein n=1 Tax=Trichoderma ghanense TaxID=65468 RepID=A0ABY2HDQ6_9HYPO